MDFPYDNSTVIQFMYKTLKNNGFVEINESPPFVATITFTNEFLSFIPGDRIASLPCSSKKAARAQASIRFLSACGYEMSSFIQPTIANSR